MKIAVIGPESGIIPFRAIGADTYPAGEKPDEIVREVLGRDYGIVFITEDTIKRLEDRKIIMETEINVVPIPGVGGETGFGRERIRELIKRAVGVDLGGEK